MIDFDEKTGYLISKDLGGIASNFYISYKSIEIFNTMMRQSMTEADAIAMISLSTEFDNIKSRDSEAKELKNLQENACACAIKVNSALRLFFFFILLLWLQRYGTEHLLRLVHH